MHSNRRSNHSLGYIIYFNMHLCALCLLCVILAMTAPNIFVESLFEWESQMIIR